MCRIVAGASRSAPVWPTPLVALVLARRAMVDPAAGAVAVVPAAAELGVERVQSLGPHSAGFRPPQKGSDVQLQVPAVGAVGGHADVQRLQVPVEQLIHRRTGARAALLVDGVEEPGSGGLCSRLLAGPGIDDLDEGVPLPRHRVLAAVYADAQRPAGQLVDRPALPPAPGLCSCHGSRVRDVRVTKRVTRVDRRS